ncbi:hypothetical protein PROFUN_12931 [Planoprotostelium fungivorum]|uniref:EGF-like domain-containing protein n=1 Tax=Planoprotostelium fungivorum TaxID=1890364 RepID=A0A2P6N603_9EUKA|nr:hypothetical protein PROFUN_12931 [Planoprotostelium fungivorum]
MVDLDTDLCHCGTLRHIASTDFSDPIIDLSVISPAADFTGFGAQPQITITSATKMSSFRCQSSECTQVDKKEWTSQSGAYVAGVPYIDPVFGVDTWFVERQDQGNSMLIVSKCEGRLYMGTTSQNYGGTNGFCVGSTLYNITSFDRNGILPIALYDDGSYLTLYDTMDGSNLELPFSTSSSQYKRKIPIRGRTLGIGLFFIMLLEGKEFYYIYCADTDHLSSKCSTFSLNVNTEWWNDASSLSESPLSVATYGSYPIITVAVVSKGLETIRCLDSSCRSIKYLPVTMPLYSPSLNPIWQVVDEPSLHSGHMTIHSYGLDDYPGRILYTYLLQNGSIVRRTCHDESCSIFGTKILGTIGPVQTARLRDSSTSLQVSFIALTESENKQDVFIYNDCENRLLNVTPSHVSAHNSTRLILYGRRFCTSRAYKCTTSDGLFSSPATAESGEQMSCTLPNTMTDGIYDITVNDVSGSVKLMVGDCGCGPHGTCDYAEGECDCQDGYYGGKCEIPPFPISTTTTTTSSKTTISQIPSTSTSQPETKSSSTTSQPETNFSSTTSQSITSSTTRYSLTSTANTTGTYVPMTSSHATTTSLNTTSTSTSALLDDSEWKDKRVKASIVIGLYVLFLAVVTAFFYFRNISYVRLAYRTERLTLLNLKNILTVVNLPIEFLQLSFFGLALREGISVTYMRRQLFSGELVMVEFFIVFACTLSWSLLVLPVMIKFKGRSLMSILMKIPAINVVLIIPFGTFLVLPSIRMLLRMSECKRVPDEVGLYVRGTTMECWTQDQIVLCVMGLIGLGIYFPLAVYILPKIQTSDGTAEILRNTRFLFIQKMLYVSIVVIQTLCSEELYNIICAIVVSFLLFLVSFDGSCNVRWINRTQTVMYIAAFWTACMSLWAQVRNKSDRFPPPLIALFAGYLLILLLFVLSWIPKISSFHRRQQTDLLSALIGRENERTPLLSPSLHENALITS